MKKIGLFSVLALFLILPSCKKKVRETENSNIKLKINTIANGTAITPGLMNKVNAAGNEYSIDMLKYYISGIVLLNENGSWVTFRNYDLIDIDDANSSWITAPKIPFGRYTKLRFALGVDSVRNHIGAQDGDLDPIHGMIWDWNTGYIFYKHEGHYKANDGSTRPLTQHLGTDRGFSYVEIPINWDVTAESKAMYLNFDINNMYNNPAVDFNIDGERMSTTAADISWVDMLASNTSDAFSVDHTE